VKKSRIGTDWSELLSNTLILLRKHEDSLQVALAHREAGLTNVKTPAKRSSLGSCKFCSLLGLGYRTGGMKPSLFLFWASLQPCNYNRIVLWTIT